VAASAATVLGADLGTDIVSAEAQVVAAFAGAVLILSVVPLAPTSLTLTPIALFSASAAAIHFGVIVDHFREWWAFGLFFLASGFAQLVWAMLAGARPTKLLLWFGLVGNAAIVVLWVVTRTAGPLLGPEANTAEPVGLADATATGFEVALVSLGILLVRSNRPSASHRFSWLAGGVTLALTTLALFSILNAAH
jgi:hypothetical protein